MHGAHDMLRLGQHTHFTVAPSIAVQSASRSNILPADGLAVWEIV